MVMTSGQGTKSTALPLPFQRGLYLRVHETRDIPSQAGNLTHQRRRNETELLCRGEKHGIDLGNQVAIHAGKLKFILEIRDCTQAAQQHEIGSASDRAKVYPYLKHPVV